MDLRAQIRAALEAAYAIAKKAADEKRGNSPEELADIEKHEAKAKELRAQLEAEERTARLAAEVGQVSTGASETQRGQQSDDAQTHRVEVNTPRYERGDAWGALIAARMRFGNDQRAAREWAQRQYGESSPQCRALGDRFSAFTPGGAVIPEARAMQASSFTAGGAFVAQNFLADELIELLRAQAAVRRAGARALTLVNGSATIPKVTGGATAYWGNEGDNMTPSELTAGDVTLTAKKLTCLVPVSNDLRRFSNLAIERIVRDDMIRAASNTEDTACLKGTGLGNQPRGIYYWVGDDGRTNSAGTSLANARTDIRTALNYLGNNNAPEVNRAWFMHSRSKNYMAWDLVDGNSNFAFPELRQGDRLADAPVLKDNNISITLGAGTDSEIYYAEMTECFVADGGDIELEVFANATYDVGGTLRSGVSRDESVVRLIRFFDFGMRHTVSAHVLEAVGYGA